MIEEYIVAFITGNGAGRANIVTAQTSNCYIHKFK